MDYYPIQKRWYRLRDLYRSHEARSIWYPEMEEYSYQRSEENDYPYRPEVLTSDLRPMTYESCDWRWSGRSGPQPHYWEYVCHSACHWVCSLHLWVAQQAEPQKQWRIVTANTHSTVWDGNTTLFDGNFLALGIKPDEAWELASQQPDSEVLPVGQLMLHS